MAELIQDAQYPVRDEGTGLVCIVTARVAFRGYTCHDCGKEIARGELFGSFGKSAYCSDCTKRGRAEHHAEA